MSDSYFDTLRQSLAAHGPSDYFVVDLQSDDEVWLSSRLYLFSYLLGELKGVRAVVFVGTRGDIARSYLGTARPEPGAERGVAPVDDWRRREWWGGPAVTSAIGWPAERTRPRVR